MSTNRNADRAKHLLRHYLFFAVQASGNKYDGDCNSEIGEIVDAIIAAVVEELQAQPAPALVQPSMFPAGEDAPLFTQPDPMPSAPPELCGRCNRRPQESGLDHWQPCDLCGRPVCDSCYWTNSDNDGHYCSAICASSTAED